MHRLWIGLIALLLPLSTIAQETTPPALQEWRGWVLKNDAFRACTLLAGRRGHAQDDYLCAWPGTLTIAADAAGARLSQHWQLEAEGWVPLPGDAEHWPQRVTVGGIATPVVDHGGPALWLGSGSHEVRAEIPWTQRPQSLRVPRAIALIALSVDGRPIVPVQREGEALTLGRGATVAAEADSVDLRVHRRLDDGVPAVLTTRIQIGVSGQAREERIGPALPEGFVALALDSEAGWPVRLEDDGRLRVQVQPGSDVLVLTARAAGPLTAAAARVPAAPWPSQEIWSYAAAPRLRVTAASGTTQVDPQQADVPPAWRDLPAFALADGDRLQIEEHSRGAAADEANRLQLVREAWLDFDGRGWFSRDRIDGRMNSGWRFDAAPPFVVQRAQARADDEPLLVTEAGQGGWTGVEWRTPDVALDAGVRIEAGSGALPIAGWQQVFDRITTTLHLPYGYRLLAAPGTDRALGSWLSGWTLLDVFVAAVVILLGARLLGWAGGLLVLAYLLIGYQEAGAPLWTLMLALALGLIARALPDGRLAEVAALARLVALALLVVVTLPFAITQVRTALYPQLEAGGGPVEPAYAQIAAGAADTMVMSEPAPPPPSPPAPEPAERAKADDVLESVTVTGSRNLRSQALKRYAQTSVVQTGGGEPGWRLGRTYRLEWSGPVLPSQEVRLLIAPPWLVRPLKLVLVALLAVLIWRLVRQAPLLPVRVRPAAAGLAAVAWACSAAVFAPSAQAQGFPSDELLGQLRDRLVEAPRCAPQCADIALAELSAEGDEVVAVLEVHALERSAVPVPADDTTLALRAARLDNGMIEGIAGVAGGARILVPRGVHRVELRWQALADKVALAFPLEPRRIAFSGSGWQAAGSADGRLLTETLSLIRLREGADGARVPGGDQQFAPFVRVVRELSLDVDWRVTTRIERMAPREGGLVANIPSLPGERVLSAGARVAEGRVELPIADGEDQAEYAATLDPRDTLTLTAPPLSGHAETWRIVVSPIWNVRFDGVPEAGFDAAQESAADYRVFEFHPLPGETLNLQITRPTAVAGATRAIDRVALSSEIGQRAATHTVQLDLRASQGGEQVLALPAGAELIGVRRGGEALNLRLQDGRLTVPVVPGLQQVEITFRQASPIATRVTTPAVSLGLPAANIDLSLRLPHDRWLLAAYGPPVGPAVLLWGELLVMVIAAIMLARWRHSPLRMHQWLLLGLGFSTFSWAALIVVAVWLFAMDARRRHAPAGALRFNLVQIALPVLTLAALLCMFNAIRNGLLGAPDMYVTGNGSDAQLLRWFADRSADALPVAGAISLPLWVYKLAMLAWALWLAWAVVDWLRLGFAAWQRGGYWRSPAPAAQLDPIGDLPPPSPPPA
ncbi:MAG TPA: hypothetical protein VMR06_17795 [Dokdonella sp.]|uniref:hypothetical protein n=1 Tax=Dokdonella sp. TaxID=2291710 RepID=UPI002C8584B0|nr:hypothetical protein [Dokdonella sp.]HUD43842.1 hypothetical protein [Dokdonella sp.]